MTKVTVARKLRRHMEESRLTAAAYAAAWGISAAYLSQVLSGARDPGPAILRVLRLRRVIRYEAL